MIKNFYWIKKYCVNRDRDNYRDDDEEIRCMFYGTINEVVECVRIRNLYFQNIYLEKFSEEHKDRQKNITFLQNQQRVKDSLSDEDKKFMHIGTYKLNLLLAENEKYLKKINNQGLWNPTKEGEHYWDWEDFEYETVGFEWVYDKDYNGVIGFKPDE